MASKLYNIAVFVSGSGSNLQAIIDAAEKQQINGKVALVIASRDGIYAQMRAQKHQIPYQVVRQGASAEGFEITKTLLQQQQIDLIVLAGYLSIVPKELVSLYENRIINIHPSLIPAFCGKGFYGEKVHQAVLDSGVKETGATVHFVDQGIDTGPIILQESVPVLTDDTVEVLQQRVLAVEHKILIAAIKQLCQ